MRIETKELKNGLRLLKTYATGQRLKNPAVVISGAGTLNQARLEIIGHDSGAFCVVDADGVGIAAHSVELAAFAATLSAKNSKTVEIAIVGENLTVEANGMTFNLQATPATLAPAFSVVDWTPAQVIDLGAWNLIANVAGTDDARPVLTAVFLSGDGTELAATDSYRLRVLSLRAAFSGVPADGALIPARAIRLAVMALKADYQPAMLSLSARAYRIECDALTVYGLLIDGTYPNYRQLMATPDKHAQVNVAELATGLSLIIAGNKAARSSSPAVMRFTEREITVTGSTVTFGLGTSSDYLGQIAFNPGFLLETANAIATDDAQALLGITSPLKPMTITHGTRGEYVTLLMPKRVPESVNA